MPRLEDIDLRVQCNTPHTRNGHHGQLNHIGNRRMARALFSRGYTERVYVCLTTSVRTKSPNLASLRQTILSRDTRISKYEQPV